METYISNYQNLVLHSFNKEHVPINLSQIFFYYEVQTYKLVILVSQVTNMAVTSTVVFAYNITRFSLENLLQCDPCSRPLTKIVTMVHSKVS